MKYHLRVLFNLIVTVLISTSALAQTEISDSDSTAFESIIEESFKELGESNNNEGVQRKYAQIFYQYYLDHSSDKYSEWALASAFKFWGNLGAVDKATEAMGKIDYNDKSWSNFIEFVPNAYHNNENKTIEDAVALLEELTGKLTDSLSKSRVNWWLAGYYHEQEDIENLKNAAREMVNLNASEIHVDQGLGYLYEIESLNIGQDAPKFKAETVQGESISLPDNNKIIILEFWATWCGPCIPEIPHLKSIQSTYSEDRLQIIGISLDTDLERLKQFITSREMSWPQIIQSEEWDGEIIKKYNVSGIPRTYIIGENGRIVAKDLRGEELEKKIANLINQK